MMKQVLMYKEDKHFAIKGMTVVGDFNEWNKEANPLERAADGIWKCEIEVEPGNYLYKFLINEGIYMNDPIANLYDVNDSGELMSCLIVDEQGERLHNTVQYHINIKKCGYEKENLHFYIDFLQVTGLHTVTTIWCHEASKSYVCSEQILVPTEDDEERISFIIDKQNNSLDIGAWNIEVFIDGKFVLEQPFILWDKNQDERIDRLFPIGTIVALKNSNKRLMIVGRMQSSINGGNIYDYSGCYFPEGILHSNHNMLFNHEQVVHIFQMGLVDEEEQVFKKQLKNLLR